METLSLPETASPAATPRAWTLALPRGRSLTVGERPRVVGILNLTPDSFSDGGRWSEPQRAVERGLAMLDEGADLLDLGAESTRPGGGVYGQGADAVPAHEEMARLLPVLEPLRAATAAPLSVDTRKGEVAASALSAGADLINDVSALGDPRLGEAVAAAGCPLILMHSRGDLRTMQQDIRYDDLLGEVRTELAAAVGRATAAGIAERQLVLDPGIGFGKTWRQNLELIARLPELAALGRPLMLGASRKSFIARVPAGREGAAPAPPGRRLGGSLAAAASVLALPGLLLRVHDVAETVQFLAVWREIAAQRAPA